MFPKIDRNSAYPAGVILVQDPAAARVDLLVALRRATHAQRSVHVHVVASQVQTDQALKQDRPPRPGRAQEDQKTRGGAPIRDHVEHTTKSRGLVVESRKISIQRIEETRDTVEKRACAGVEGHVV